MSDSVTNQGWIIGYCRNFFLGYKTLNFRKHPFRNEVAVCLEKVERGCTQEKEGGLQRRILMEGCEEEVKDVRLMSC